MDHRIDWLLGSGEPWTRYRTLVDLLGETEDSREVSKARQEMLDHPQVRELVDIARTWPGYPLKRHNDARHPLYAISTLADFGAKSGDPGIGEVVESVQKHRSPQGMFETKVLIPQAFGGSGQEDWTWMLCDSPTLLYSLHLFGGIDKEYLSESVESLSKLAADNGWHCGVSPELGQFKGPGRREDPCPMANVYALKTLSVFEDFDEKSARKGTGMLLQHWQLRKERKYFLFGMGTDFSKIKYPFIWYDILHVMEVLSRFSWTYQDPGYLEMLDVITRQANQDGMYTAGSMYMAWKGWSFADKKIPSPWLTFLVMRIEKRSITRLN